MELNLLFDPAVTRYFRYLITPNLRLPECSYSTGAKCSLLPLAIRPALRVFTSAQADCLQHFHPESAEAKHRIDPVNPVSLVFAFSFLASQPPA